MIRQRRGLPNGRAVAGGLLVALAAIGGWLIASGGDGNTRSYVVATRDLAPGHRLVPGDLATASLDLPPAQARGLFVDAGALSGGVTRGPIQRGSLVTAADVAAAADSETAGSTSTRELSMELPAAQALNGQLLPGDRVDVVATDGSRSKVLVQRALVIAVSGGGEGGLVGGSGTVVVTLALSDPTAALATANGAAAAEITLLRSTLAQDQLPSSTDLSAAVVPANAEQPSATPAPASAPAAAPAPAATAAAPPPTAAPPPAPAPTPAAPAQTTTPAKPAVGG